MNHHRLHEDPARTKPIGLARYAADFFDAAIAADDVLGHRTGYEITAPVPVMFLVGQAIELALKAFLLHRGVELRQLRYDYGHELHRALKKAKELGLYKLVPLTTEEEAMVELLNTLYASKQLQYIVSGPKTYPVFGPLEAVARKLVFGIGPVVGYAPR